jgi:hypothetical protein
MSKQDKENEVYTRKNQNMLTEAKDNPETDIYENPIKNGAERSMRIRPMKTSPNF